MAHLSPPFLPTADLVGVAWLRQRTRLAPAQVATSLPDVAKWTDGGFVTASALAAGPVDVDIAQRRLSVLTVDCWAIKGQWNMAAQLAEVVREATEQQAFGGVVETAPDYYDARVQAVYLTTDPRRVRDDPSGFARLTFDVRFDWLVDR